MKVDIDTVVQSFGDYYDPRIFGDMNDRTGTAFPLPSLFYNNFQYFFHYEEKR